MLELQQKCKHYQTAAKKKARSDVPGQPKVRTEDGRPKSEQKKQVEKEPEVVPAPEETKQPAVWQPHRYTVLILSQDVVYEALTEDITDYHKWLRHYAQLQGENRLEILAAFKQALKEVFPTYEVSKAD